MRPKEADRDCLGWPADSTHVESRNAHPVESLGEIVDVNLHERRSIPVLGGDARKYGRHLSARLTPSRGEVHYQERLRPDHFHEASFNTTSRM